MSSIERHINLHGRCKACRLLKQDIGLFDEVHQRLLIKKHPVTTVVKWLNSRLDVINSTREEPIVEFSPQNFYLHLDKHITDKGKLIRDLAIPPPAITQSTFSEVEELTANLVLSEGVTKKDKVGPLDAFEESELTADVILMAMKTYRAEVKKDLDEGKRPNAAYVKSMHDMVESVIQLQKSINQTRNSSKVAGEAVRKMAHDLNQAYISKLIDVTEEVDKLISNQVEGSFSGEVAKLIRARMGEGMKASLLEVYNSVIQEFGIK